MLGLQRAYMEHKAVHQFLRSAVTCNINEYINIKAFSLRYYLEYVIWDRNS